MLILLKIHLLRLKPIRELFWNAPGSKREFFNLYNSSGTFQNNSCLRFESLTDQRKFYFKCNDEDIIHQEVLYNGLYKS